MGSRICFTDFSGKNSWYYRFMKSHGLSMCPSTRTAEYKTKILEFQKSVIPAREKSCFQPGQIGNMDEVGLTFSVPSNRILGIKRC